MIVYPKDLEYDLTKRQDFKTDMAIAVSDGDMTATNAAMFLQGCGDPVIKETHEFCFSCGKKLHIPAVMWAGVNGRSGEPLDIWLHPQCAEHLAYRLLRDVNELKHGKEQADMIFNEWDKGQGEGQSSKYPTTPR